ncbi:hypothetical protein FKP32DRAFT_719140 [Trametes sanguinea]|nr:hypothetical protein FKP32DRAFT_719140 [Trametes sanguinea]
MGSGRRALNQPDSGCPGDRVLRCRPSGASPVGDTYHPRSAGHIQSQRTGAARAGTTLGGVGAILSAFSTRASPGPSKGLSPDRLAPHRGWGRSERGLFVRELCSSPSLLVGLGASARSNLSLGFFSHCTLGAGDATQVRRPCSHWLRERRRPNNWLGRTGTHSATFVLARTASACSCTRHSPPPRNKRTHARRVA